MKKTLPFSLLFIFLLQACDEYEIGEYTPLPKLHLGETFKYLCIPENYTRLAYDSLGDVAVLNFHKEEIADLDYGMWYRMNHNRNDEYILEANDGMTVRTVVYRTNQDSINLTIKKFRIEEYNQ